MKNKNTFGSTCLVILLASHAAGAEESPYCAKVRSRASSDSALLLAPTVQAAGIKFPASGSTDSGVTTGAGYQFRASLSVSPLDVYRGIQVRSVGEKDCKAHEAEVVAVDAMLQGTDFATLAALKQEADYLDSQVTVRRQVMAKSEERLLAKVISLLDVSEVRKRDHEIERRRARIAGEIGRLEAHGVGAASRRFDGIIQDVNQATMEHERGIAAVRRLDGWSVNVSAGLIPQARPVDVFGVVQVGVSLGVLSRSAAETRYVEAREREVSGARYELADQVRRLDAQVRILREQTRREVAIAEAESASIAAARDLLQLSDAPNVPHALAIFTLESILAESRRAYLAGLLGELSRFEERSS